MPNPSILAFDRVAANNGAGVTAINFAENQNPGSVNDSARSLMSRLAYYRDWLAGNITQGGTGNAYTLTSGETLTAYSAGMRFLWKPNASSTGAVTLNVDGIGAKKVFRPDGTQAGDADILTGTLLDVVYLPALDSAAGGFQIIGGLTEATSLSMSAQYRLVGRSSAGAGPSQEIASSANVFALLGAADYAAMRAQLDLEAGTDFLSPSAIASTYLTIAAAASGYQPLNANLTSWAGVTPSAKADDNAVVHLAGTETVSGVKTYSSAPKFSAGFEWGNNIYGTATSFAATIGANPAASVTAGGYVQLYGSTHASGPLVVIGASGPTLNIGASSIQWSGVNIPTVSSTDTLSNKTLASPTLSGTVAGAVSFSSQIRFASSSPSTVLVKTDGGSNAKNWRTYVSGNVLVYDLLNDAENAATVWLGVTRSGTTATSIDLTSTALTHNGSAVPTVSSSDTLSNKTLASPVVSGSIELGHATDTSLARLAAGQLGVEGKAALQHDGSYTSGKVTLSTSDPSGGSDGDVWFKYTP